MRHLRPAAGSGAPGMFVLGDQSVRIGPPHRSTTARFGPSALRRRPAKAGGRRAGRYGPTAWARPGGRVAPIALRCDRTRSSCSPDAPRPSPLRRRLDRGADPARGDAGRHRDRGRAAAARRDRADGLHAPDQGHTRRATLGGGGRGGEAGGRGSHARARPGEGVRPRIRAERRPPARPVRLQHQRPSMGRIRRHDRPDDRSRPDGGLPLPERAPRAVGGGLWARP